MPTSTELDRREALAAAVASDHWETISMVQKTLVTRMTVPGEIDDEMPNSIQGLL